MIRELHQVLQEHLEKLSSIEKVEYWNQQYLNANRPIKKSPAIFLEYLPYAPATHGLNQQRYTQAFIAHIFTKDLSGEPLFEKHFTIMTEVYVALQSKSFLLSDISRYSGVKNGDHDFGIISNIRRMLVEPPNDSDSIMISRVTFEGEVVDISACTSFSEQIIDLTVKCDKLDDS